MATFKERVKDLRLSSNLSVRQLSAISGISKSALSSYECGKREPSFESLEALADVFNCDINYLLGRSDIKCALLHGTGYNSLYEAYKGGIDLQLFAEEKRPLRRLGAVSCGQPIYAEEVEGDFFDGIGADFVLTAKGDSMVNAHIFDGDTLFVKETKSVNDGDIAVVLIGDEATVKRVYRHKGTITLQPENPAFKPRVLSSKDNFTVLGIVVGVFSKI